MYFQVCGGIFLLLLIVIYFTKKRINTFETKLYAILLVLNLLGLSIDLVSTSFSLLNMHGAILTCSSKLYLVYLFTFYFLFAIYLKSLIVEKIKKKNVYSLKEVISKKYIKLISFIYMVISIAILLLPLENYSDGSIVYTYGLAVDFISFLAVIMNIIIIYLIIKHGKKLEVTKLIPIVSLVVLGALASLIQLNFPALLIMTFVYIVISFVMYFTIENPDIKLINELNVAKDEAVKANLAKSNFLSSMSHEIRTPLNAIIGLSNNIADSKDLSYEVREDLEDIVNASNTLLDIVGNILDINKIESSKIEVKKYKYNIEDLVNSVVKVNEPRIGTKKINVSVDLAPDLPYQLLGDAGHIKTIFTNLLSNAIKYTEKGKIEVRVKCINKNNKCLVIISVEDTGRGIKAENVSRLFSKFDRLEADKNTTIEGTGLGLAITKQLVNLLGGSINVQSDFGKGSLFIVQIPQEIGESSKPLENTQVINAKAIKSALEVKKYNGVKVLIVDDNMLNIKVAKRLLSDYEFDFDECYDGLECLDKVKNNKYNLILMDIMMPNMNGEEALKKLQDTKKFKTPVIALTADALTDAQSKYIDLGFSDYISKPFTKDQIVEKIQKLI